MREIETDSLRSAASLRFVRVVRNSSDKVPQVGRGWVVLKGWLAGQGLLPQKRENRGFIFGVSGGGAAG
jgi:hypothetical protein